MARIETLGYVNDCFGEVIGEIKIAADEVDSEGAGGKSNNIKDIDQDFAGRQIARGKVLYSLLARCCQPHRLRFQSGAGRPSGIHHMCRSMSHKWLLN